MGDGIRVFGEFFYAYLRERSMEKILAMVSDNIISIGTGGHEIAIGKAAFEKLYHTEFELNPDPVKFSIAETREFRTSATCATVFARIKIFIPQRDNILPGAQSIDGRFTGTCSLQDNKWLIDSLHMSMASPDQDNDSFFPAFHRISSSDISPEEVQETLATSLPNIIPCGILCAYTEKGLPFYLINDELLSYVDYTYDEFLDITEGMAINIVHPDDRAMVERLAFEGLKAGHEYDAQFRLVKKDLSFIWVYARGKPLKLTDGRDIFVSVTINISKMVALQEKLTDEAARDVLTPVFNRRAMIKMVETSFMQTPHGCFFIIDIDNFKKLNDTLGHQVGDAVLQEAATLMLRRTRSTDIVARIGGDEFAIYYPGLRSAAVAKKRADQLRRDFIQVARHRYGAVNVSLSIGAVFRNGEMDFDALYHSADQALYVVKKSSKDGYCLYQNEVNAPQQGPAAESGGRGKHCSQSENSPVER